MKFSKKIFGKVAFLSFSLVAGIPFSASCAYVSNVFTYDHINDKDIIITGLNDFGLSNKFKQIKVSVKNFNVVKISDDAFKNNDFLEKVYLPSSIKTIGTSAFENCFNLKTVNFPKGLEEIGSYAFSSTRLKEINFDYVSPKEDSLYRNILNIGEYSFARCNHIESVSFSRSLCSISTNSFICNDLKTIIFVQNTCHQTSPIDSDLGCVISPSAFLPNKNCLIHLPKKAILYWWKPHIHDYFSLLDQDRFIIDK